MSSVNCAPWKLRLVAPLREGKWCRCGHPPIQAHTRGTSDLQMLMALMLKAWKMLWVEAAPWKMLWMLLLEVVALLLRGLLNTLALLDDEMLDGMILMAAVDVSHAEESS